MQYLKCDICARSTLSSTEPVVKRMYISERDSLVNLIGEHVMSGLASFEKWEGHHMLNKICEDRLMFEKRAISSERPFECSHEVVHCGYTKANYDM